jgi:hypothetical protein
MSRFEKTREGHSESRSDSIIFILVRHQTGERGSVNEGTPPGRDALKKRTRVQDDFVSAASRRACPNAFFPQIKLAGKAASLIFSEVHAHTCNLSSLGLSNICAQGGFRLNLTYVGNVQFFFVCESMPSKE